MPCTCGHHRTPQGCAGARHFAQRPVTCCWGGKQGGLKRARKAEERLAERYAHLTREQAITAAWRDARAVERHLQQRMQRRDDEAQDVTRSTA